MQRLYTHEINQTHTYSRQESYATFHIHQTFNFQSKSFQSY